MPDSNMQHTLKSIFDAITPDNIKDIDLVKDTIDIFIQTLNEKSGVSKDVTNIFKNDVEPVLKEAIVKTYLDDFYRVISELPENRQIAEKNQFYKDNFNISYMEEEFFKNPLENIDIEEYVISRSFKQKKGLKSAIEYFYEFASDNIVKSDDPLEIEFVEKEPFNFDVSGSVPVDVYNNFVRPLAHPLGFVFTYTHIVQALLVDYFNIDVQYTNTTVEVRCLDGNTDVYDQKVVDVQEFRLAGIDYRRVVFDDGTYLEQTSNPIVVKYYDEDGNVLKDYSNMGVQCTLYVDYTVVFVILTTDEIAFDVEMTQVDAFMYDGDAKYSPLIIGFFTIGNDDVLGGYSLDTSGLNYRGIREELSFETDKTFNDQHLASDPPIIGEITINDFEISGDGVFYDVLRIETADINLEETIVDNFDTTTDNIDFEIIPI